MKKDKLVNNHWYWIEYKTKKGYRGPGKYIGQKPDDTKIYLEFYIPKYQRTLIYYPTDVKHQCKPAPEYDELLEKCGLTLEDFKYDN